MKKGPRRPKCPEEFRERRAALHNAGRRACVSMRDRYRSESGPDRTLFGIGCDRSTVVKLEMSAKNVNRFPRATTESRIAVANQLGFRHAPQRAFCHGPANEPQGRTKEEPSRHPHQSTPPGTRTTCSGFSIGGQNDRTRAIGEWLRFVAPEQCATSTRGACLRFRWSGIERGGLVSPHRYLMVRACRFSR